MLFWQAWHLRNDVIHGDGKGSIVGSTKFLVSYWDSLSFALHGPAPATDAKGKAVVVGTSKKRNPSIPDGSNNDHTQQIWVRPP
jgi:hypothetical protein